MNSPANASCNIYELDSDRSVVLIPCNYEVKDKDSLNFAKAIMNGVQATRIVILDTLSPANYNSTLPDIEYTYPWLRLLQTAGSTTVTKIPALEVPNLVQNLGAALMSYVRRSQICWELFNPKKLHASQNMLIVSSLPSTFHLLLSAKSEV